MMIPVQDDHTTTETALLQAVAETERAWKADRANPSARQNYSAALKRLNEFLLYGSVPFRGGREVHGAEMRA